MKHSSKKPLIALALLLALIGSGYLIYRLSFTAFVGLILLKDEAQKSRALSRKYKSFDDHNDSRISYYLSEYRRANRAYLGATDAAGRFKAKVRRKFALDCLGYFLRDCEKEGWLQHIQTIGWHDRDWLRREAKPLHSKEAEFFDRYYFNQLDYAMEHVASPFDEAPSRCDRLLSTERLFSIFIPLYIGMKKRSIEEERADLAKAHYFGKLNKSFYRRAIRDDERLMRILRRSFPTAAHRPSAEEDNHSIDS
ncbi:hypothetical protein [Nitratifractor sp.]